MTIALQKSKESAQSRHGREITIVMTKTTTLVAPGVRFTHVNSRRLKYFPSIWHHSVHPTLADHSDGGDCCGSEKNYAFCKACKCLDCTFKFKSDKCMSKIKGTCGAKNFVGDGFCDDSNNNAGCSWDDGDCCGSTGKVSCHPSS